MNTGDAVLTSPRILILGMSAGGTTSLPTGLLARIAAADLLVGGRGADTILGGARAYTIGGGAGGEVLRGGPGVEMFVLRARTADIAAVGQTPVSRTEMTDKILGALG